MNIYDNIIKSFSVEERELFSLLSESEKEAAIKKIASGELSPYVFGKKYFFKNYFIINSSCLIPRPDTERVVEKVLSLLPQNDAKIADLCCGCGCIGLSVLDEKKDCAAFLADISTPSLEAAEKNAENLFLSRRVTFAKSDILKDDPMGEELFDIIVSNPPYLRSDEIPLCPGLSKEPRIALDGGEDGMMFYRRIIKNFRKNLKDNGCFVFEIGYSQKEDIENLAKAFELNCSVTKDYGGNYRVAVLRRQI